MGIKAVSPGATISSAIVQLSRGFAIAFIAMILIITSGQYNLDWQTALPKLSYAIVMWISAGLLLINMGAFKWMPKVN